MEKLHSIIKEIGTFEVIGINRNTLIMQRMFQLFNYALNMMTVIEQNLIVNLTFQFLNSFRLVCLCLLRIRAAFQFLIVDQSPFQMYRFQLQKSCYKMFLMHKYLNKQGLICKIIESYNKTSIIILKNSTQKTQNNFNNLNYLMFSCFNQSSRLIWMLNLDICKLFFIYLQISLVGIIEVMSGQHINEEDVFGSTAEAHAGLMDVLWGPGINIAIFLSFYSYRKWWGILHGLFGVFACIYTLATSLPILFYTGIIPKDSTQNLKFSASVLNPHYLVGIACMFVIAIETVMGVITKLMYYCSTKSMTIINMKKAHAIFGYLIIILCKSDYVIIQSQKGQYWGLVIQDMIFLIVGIIWKLKFPRMEAKANQLPQEEEVKSILSVSQLDKNKDYAVFANYVYDVQELKHYHPAGYQIVESVKNKQIDRYIYGMFASEQLPEVPIYSHSYKSFTLVGPPVAKITIPSTFSGFKKDEVIVNISSLKLICEKGQIYEMALAKEGEESFNFQKYTDMTQLGRYYSLTLNQKTTRLYTSVNFLVNSNKAFMKKNLKGYSEEYGTYVKLNECKSQKYKEEEMPEKTNTQMMEEMSQSYVPILFKRYPGGKLTDALVKGSVNQLRLSCPKGEGLHFKSLRAGRVILVAGGTGIYPFCDLIDLLFKDQLARENQQVMREVRELSPILNSNPFSAFSFHLMAAFNSLDDVHPITLHQIAFLSSRRVLTLTLKAKDSVVGELFTNAKIISGSFEGEIEKELKSGPISKILICGPPRMNENLGKFLRELNKTTEDYLIL